MFRRGALYVEDIIEFKRRFLSYQWIKKCFYMTYHPFIYYFVILLYN